MDSQTLKTPLDDPSLIDFDSFYISRVLANVALVRVGVVSDLHSAEALMRVAARQIPGAYLVFNGRTHRVVSKLVSRVRSR